jgi:N-methylhydantoinase A
MNGSIQIGIDIGGTFTDAACIVDGGQLLITKTPSTPDDPIRAVGLAIDELLKIADLPSQSVRRFAHCTPHLFESRAVAVNSRFMA